MRASDIGPRAELMLTAGRDVVVQDDGRRRVRRWSRAGVGALLVASVIGGGAASAFADTPAPVPSEATASAAGELRSTPDESHKVERVATSLGTTTDVALDGNGSAYVTNSKYAELLRVNTVSGDKDTVANGLLGASSVALDGNGNAYVTTADGVLWRVNTVSGDKDKVAAGLNQARRVALDGNGNAYVAGYMGDPGSYTAELWRVNTVSGDKERVATDGGRFLGVALDGKGNAYVINIDSGVLSRVNTDSKEKERVATGLGTSMNVALDGNGNAYVGGGSDLWRVNLSGSEKPKKIMVDSSINGASGLALDGEGNAYLTRSHELLRVVDVATPVKPAAPQVTSPEQDATVDGARPEITGTGIAGATVTMKVKDGDTLGETAVDQNGTWKFVPSADLPVGKVSLLVTQSKDGKTSDPAERTFTIADQTVDAPEIILPAADSTQPSMVKFEGTAAADKGVTKVKLTDEEGEEIRTLGVDAKSGKWWTSNSKLIDFKTGKHTVTATGITSDGKESKSVTRSFTVQAGPTVTKPEQDSTQPSKVKFEGMADRKGGVHKVELADKGQKPFATVKVGDNGQWWISNSKLPTLAEGKHTVTATGITADGRTAATEVTFTVLANAPAPVITKPADGSEVTGGLVKFEGTAAADKGVTQVKLYDETTKAEIGTYKVNAEGQWWISNSKLPTLAEGKHTVTATGIFADGSATPASTTTFTVN